jgi:hypothetical protein
VQTTGEEGQCPRPLASHGVRVDLDASLSSRCQSPLPQFFGMTSLTTLAFANLAGEIGGGVRVRCYEWIAVGVLFLKSARFPVHPPVCSEALNSTHRRMHGKPGTFQKQNHNRGPLIHLPAVPASLPAPPALLSVPSLPPVSTFPPVGRPPARSAP